MTDVSSPDTAEVFDHFAALMSVAPGPGGLLVFYGKLDRCGTATAVAGNIAGATSLGIDADRDRIKRALRQGFCDFMVNSLDETLRILKNQIRKKESVAVALMGNLEHAVGEMLGRGVQPDLVACDAWGSGAFIERGAKSLPAAAAMDGSLVVTWSVSPDAAMWLPRVDAIAVDALENPSDPRATWIRMAPRYLRALTRERYARMRTDELARFLSLLQQQTHAGEIGVPVQVSSNGIAVAQPEAADSSAAV
jgi:Urocanase Rossmann-like domain